MDESRKSKAVDYKPKARDKLIIERVLNDFETFSDALRDKHKHFSDFLKHYHNVVQKKRKQGQANVPAPLAAETVDTVHADIVDKTIGSDGLLVDITPGEATDIQHAEASKDLIQHQLYVEEAETVWGQLVKTCLQLGTAPAKVSYVERYKTFTERQPVIDMFGNRVGFERVRSEKLVYKGPAITPVDIFDFFPHPDMVELDDDVPIIHRFIATPEHIKERARQGLYKNTRYVDFEKKISQLDDGDHAEKRERRELAGIKYHAATRLGVECYEWQGMYDLHENDIRVNCVFVVTSDGVLLRADELPYDDQEKTYICPRINRTAGEFWGVGLIEKQHPMIHGLNALNNTLLDALYQAVHKKRLIDSKGIPNKAELVNRQGQIIRIQRRGAGEPLDNYYRELDVGRVAPDVWQAMGMYQDWASKASGVADFMKGYLPSKVQSATAIQTTSSQASAKFRLLLKEIENTGSIPICKRMQKINLQFFDQAEVVRVIGRRGLHWRTINPEDIAGEVHFVALGSTREIDKGVNIQQLMQTIQVASGSPQLQKVITILFLALTDQFKLPHRDMIQDILGWEQQKTQYYEQMKMQIAQMQMQRGEMPNIPEITGGAGGRMQPRTEQIPGATNQQELLATMNAKNRTFAGGSA